MDQKRLIVAIAISIAILLGFQFLLPKAPPRPASQETAAAVNRPLTEPAARSADPSFPGTEPEAVPPPKDVAPPSSQRRPGQRHDQPARRRAG